MRKQKVNLGGERLGSGDMMNVTLSSAQTSHHNLSRIWRSSMTNGTLVPFLTEVILPGDRMKCHLEAKVRTQPTIGPLFGFFEVKAELFKVPMRYYMAPLHNNFVDVGEEMDNVKIPQMRLRFQESLYPSEDMRLTDAATAHTAQVAQDSLMAYMGVRAVGTPVPGDTGGIVRDFSAIPMLAMADIYKQYYANTQTKLGAIMSQQTETDAGIAIQSVYVVDAVGNLLNSLGPQWWGEPQEADYHRFYAGERMQILAIGEFDNIGTFSMLLSGGTRKVGYEAIPVWGVGVNQEDWDAYGIEKVNIIGLNSIQVVFKSQSDFDFYTNDTWMATWQTGTGVTGSPGFAWDLTEEVRGKSAFGTFDLKNIDDMRMAILKYGDTPGAQIVNEIAEGRVSPYSEMWGHRVDASGVVRGNYQNRLNGLFVRAHKSDRFQTWLNTSWIDGPTGVTATSAIDVSGGILTMDELNLAKRVYELLNRTIAAGNTYAAWLKARWNVEKLTQVEQAIYLGGMSGMIGFDEVVSTAEAGPDTQPTMVSPLGSLAGRGVANGLRGESTIQISEDEEPSFLIGVISIVPMVDYSQGNKWWTRLKSLEELHVPQFDGIGFQDLITDEIVAVSTYVTPGAAPATDTPGEILYTAIGKQPAWIQYQTAVNECYGTFAYQTEAMFMTLARVYQGNTDDGIDDFLPYINPAMYLQAFATANRTDQPFWMQVGVTLHAERLMSATAIPNL